MGSGGRTASPLEEGHDVVANGGLENGLRRAALHVVGDGPGTARPDDVRRGEGVRSASMAGRPRDGRADDGVNDIADLLPTVAAATFRHGASAASPREGTDRTFC